MVSSLQVAPPSVVASTPASPFAPKPTAKQVLVEGQARGWDFPKRKESLPEGRCWMAHDAPAFVVETTVGAPFELIPTAKQVVVEGHAMPCATSRGAL
jgi:hypothetical protein